MIETKLMKDLLRYGNIITDDQYEKNGDFIRTRIISYNGNAYYHKMKNGNIIEFKELK